MSIHAWFSAERALRHGSAVYRKPGGATVNVTRMSLDFESKGTFPHDERYRRSMTLELRRGDACYPHEFILLG